MHGSTSPSSLLRDATRLRDALLGLVRVVQAWERDRYSRHGLSPSQSHALQLLTNSGPMAVNDMAVRLRLEKSTASRLANSLVDRGLARKRTPAEDGRVVILQATETGLRLSRRILNDLTEAYVDILAGLPWEVRQGLPGFLEALAGSFATRTHSARAGEGYPL